MSPSSTEQNRKKKKLVVDEGDDCEEIYLESKRKKL